VAWPLQGLFQHSRAWPVPNWLQTILLVPLPLDEIVRPSFRAPQPVVCQKAAASIPHHRHIRHCVCRRGAILTDLRCPGDRGRNQAMLHKRLSQRRLVVSKQSGNNVRDSSIQNRSIRSHSNGDALSTRQLRCSSRSNSGSSSYGSTAAAAAESVERDVSHFESTNDIHHPKDEAALLQPLTHTTLPRMRAPRLVMLQGQQGETLYVRHMAMSL